jgi:choline kinase
MRAILLVAGVGRRLGDPTKPKSMLEFGGQSLFTRHLAALEQAKCSALTIVVGHLHEQLRAELARLVVNYPVTVRENPDFKEGSVVSLFVARDDLRENGRRGEATVVMDGDVLYEPQLLEALRDRGGTSAFLVDTQSEETGEEMMVAVRNGAVRRIARRVYKGDSEGAWDLVGESVGFMKIGAQHAEAMASLLEAHVAAGHRNTEYEAVYDTFFKTHEVGIVDVGASPWTEIDFEADVARARDEILPAIEARRIRA